MATIEKLLSSTLNDTFSNSRRYSFLLKEARIYWKIFEAEEDKKKKVYPRLPDVWGKKDTPYYFIVFPFPDQSTEC